MAAETTQQPDVSAGGTAPAGEAAASKGTGGLGAYLPLLISFVFMSAAGGGMMWFFNKPKTETTATAEKSKDGHAPEAKGGHGTAKPAAAHGSSSHDTGKDKGSSGSGQRNTQIPIPLTREVVVYREADPNKAKNGEDYDKIVTVNTKGEPVNIAQPDKIVVNIANTSGRAFAVARFSMVGNDSELIRKINENRERLLDVAAGALSSKTLEDIDRPGFKNLLRSELVVLFNQHLGNSVQSVVVTDFATQQ